MAGKDVVELSVVQWADAAPPVSVARAAALALLCWTLGVFGALVHRLDTFDPPMRLGAARGARVGLPSRDARRSLCIAPGGAFESSGGADSTREDRYVSLQVAPWNLTPATGTRT